MKIPATCPGVLDKAAKKAFKEEKRTSIALNSTAVELGNGDGYSTSGVSRSNTMNSTLSSSHSTGGGGLRSMRSVGSRLSKSNSTTTPTTRSRILAPPPEKYLPPEDIPELPTEDNSPKGRMLYPYNATGEGEISLEDGKEVSILEPDGMYSIGYEECF